MKIFSIDLLLDDCVNDTEGVLIRKWFEEIFKESKRKQVVFQSSNYIKVYADWDSYNIQSVIDDFQDFYRLKIKNKRFLNKKIKDYDEDALQTLYEMVVEGSLILEDE